MLPQLIAGAVVALIVALLPSTGPLPGLQPVEEVRRMAELQQGPRGGRPLVLRAAARIEGWAPADVPLPDPMTNVKRRVGSNGEFRYNAPEEHEVIAEMSRDQFLHELDQPGQFVYWTQPGSWAEEIMRPLRQTHAPASLNLWIGSRGATATAHYDEEDNFFLQLHGRKRFSMAPPEYALRLHVHSSLDAGWRQARVRVPPADVVEGGFEVTLEPGDMLYLPPYWMHWVTAESVSVSVNAWTPAPMAQVAQDLARVPLPHNDDGMTHAERLGALRDVLVMTQDLLGVRLGEALRVRFGVEAAAADAPTVCPASFSEQVLLAVRRCAVAVAGHVSEGCASNEAIATLLLADYAEEIAAALVGEELAGEFLTACVP